MIRNTCRASTGLLLLPLRHSLAEAGGSVAVEVLSAAPVPLPPDFIGLGYEMSSVATPGLLSADNQRYVRLVRLLGQQGLVRVGGIVADYTQYSANGPAAYDPHHTVLTRAALEQFAGFLRKIGWKAIWSVNFAQGTIAEAVAEAQAVASVLGTDLHAFELGNEVENYARGARTFRNPPYRYEDYRAEYLEWHDAIARAIPAARFAAPDTAGDIDWVELAARDASRELQGKLQLLTTHYYRNEQRHGSAAQLRQPDPELPEKLARLTQAAQVSGIPWRMCETNSFSGGGLPGVSNSLLGALWTLDYMLLLASYGCSGVNMETGVNQLGFISCYSPIGDDGHGANSAGAPYYGMLAFTAAGRGCTHSIKLQITGAPDTLTAYALGQGSSIRSAIVVNRGDEEAAVSLQNLGIADGSVMLLATSSPGSGAAPQFCGASVDSDGRWHAVRSERLHGGPVKVPGMSAVVVRR